MTPRTWRAMVRGWNRRMSEQSGDGRQIMPLEEAQALAEYYREIDAEKNGRT